ncbi:hypothetical protein TRAPUB_6461 [Trametes pubescens]|uniref:Alcohol acetyltransferase FCK4 n=1 Tax=Trametes pubescens TaxID=154538 RepID=A0A1M2V5X9_TRAPU|nr:hypothetical protein TRAPUB_6461 [Trametes pubescens]
MSILTPRQEQLRPLGRRLSRRHSRISTHRGGTGFLETFFHTRTRIGVDSCVIVAARYQSGLNDVLDKSTLFAALEDVIHDHAELGVRISVGDGVLSTQRGPPTWVRLAFLDLSRTVEFVDVDSSNLSSLLEAQFTRPFDLGAKLPLWRLVVLSDGTVVFAYDHVMGDGQSGLAFHLSLLDALQKIRDPPVKHSGSVTAPPGVAMLPPVEDAMLIPVPLTRLLSEVNKAINPFHKRRRTAVWSGNPIPKAFKFGVHVRILHMSPDEAASLLRQCRAHQTTITGAVYALISYIFARLLRISDEPKPKYTSIGVFVPVSLRRYTGAPPTAICNHVSYYQDIHELPTVSSCHSPTAYPIPSDFPWAVAARFSETLRREAPHTPAMLGVMNTLVGAGERYSRGLLGKKREMTLEISNLGPVPAAAAPTSHPECMASASGWSIQEAIFAQADATPGAALKINVTGTPAGGLGISLTWGRESLDEEFAEACVGAFVAGMKELAVVS